MSIRTQSRTDFFSRCRRALRPQPGTPHSRFRPMVVEPLENRIVLAAAIGLTHTGTISVDLDGDGQADPGDTLTYTFVITNSGDSDATGISFADLLDPNTTLDPASINISPLAINDTYTTAGNTLLQVGLSSGGAPSHKVLGSVFDNDMEFLGDTFALSKVQGISILDGEITVASSAGGTVTMNLLGQFSYIPAPGFTGTDTFTYTITDDGIDPLDPSDDLSSTATVTIHVGTVVWYVDNSYVGTSDGTSLRPFTSLASLSGTGGVGDVDGAGHVIYVAKGNAAYTSAIELENNQKLIGGGVALKVDGMTLAAAGAATEMTGTGNLIKLNNVSAEIHGFSLRGGTNAVEVTVTGANSINAVIRDNTITDATGKGIGILANSTGTVTMELGNNTISSAGNGIDAVRNSGALQLNISGNNVTSTSGTGILVSGGATASTYITGFANNVISGNTGGTGVNISYATFDQTPGGIIQPVSGGVLTVGAVGNGVGGAGVVLTNVSGALNFTDLDIVANGGAGLRVHGDTGGFTLGVSAGVATVNAIGGPAVDLQAVAATLPFVSLTSSNSPTQGIRLANISGSFSAGAGSIVTAAGIDFEVDQGTAVISYGGAITNTFGRSVSISNLTGGSVTLSGAISDTAQGILISSNVSTVTTAFTGGLTLSTGANPAFVATNGGNLKVTGANNTITTTTGTALNLLNTGITAENLNFKSISVNGAVNGIVLNGTGTAGGLILGGGGTALGHGGLIQNTTGDAISLTNTANVSLSYLSIKNAKGHGVSGTGVNNFAILHSEIVGAGDANEEDALFFSTLGRSNITGTLRVEDTLVKNFMERGLSVENNRGNLTVNVINSRFVDNDDTYGTQAISVRSEGTAGISLNVTDSTFTDIEGHIVEFIASGSGVNDVNLLRNTSSGGGGPDKFPGGGGIVLAVEDGFTLTFNVKGNTLNNVTGDGIIVVGEGNVQGRIGGVNATDGNIITHAGLGGGTEAGDALRIDFDGLASSATGAYTWNILVQNNTFDLKGIGDDGIQVLNRDHSGTLNLTIEGNTIKNSLSEAIRVFTAERDGGGSPTTNLKISGNFISGIGAEESIYIIGDDATKTNLTITGNSGATAGSSPSGTLVLERRVAGATMAISQADANALRAQNNGMMVAVPMQPVTFGNIIVPALPTHSLIYQPELSSPGVAVAPSAEPEVSNPEPPVIPAIPIAVVPEPVSPTPFILDDGVLSQAELDFLVVAAIARWAASGITPEQVALLQQVRFEIVDLPGWSLGTATPGLIQIDSNAGGNSWFIDPTPLDDSEFAGSGTRLSASGAPAAGRIDALTTVMHELGHILGLDDSYSSADRDNLMYGWIGHGERRLPVLNQADGVIPDAGHSGPAFSFAPLSIGTLPAGHSVTVVFNATVNATVPAGADHVVNKATITGTNFPTVEKTSTLTLDAAPDLAITGFSDGVNTVLPGNGVIYTITYANVGNQGATNVKLRQTLPAGAVFDASASALGWTETTPGSRVYELSIGTLNSGATGTATFAYSVPNPVGAGVESLTSTVTILDDDANGLDPAANDSLSDTNSVNARPDLSLTITDGVTTATPGSTVSYSLSYANTGDQNASGVILTQTLPVGTSFNAAESSTGWTETALGSGVYQLSLGTVAGGSTGARTFAFDVISPAASGLATLQTTATIFDDGAGGAEADLTNNTANDANTLVASPDLRVTLSDGGRTSVTPGTTYTYTLAYENAGNQTATGVYLTQTVPTGASFVAGSSTPGWTQVSPGLYRLELGTVSGGTNGSATFAISVTNPAVSGATQLTATAEIGDNGVNGADPTPLDNTSTDTNTLNAAPDLVISVTDGLTSAIAGQSVVYTLSYRNDGTQNATGVTLRQYLPNGAAFDATKSTAGWAEVEPGIYELSIGALAGTENGTALFAVKVNDRLASGIDALSTVVRIFDDGSNGSDLNEEDNEAGDTTRLDAVPDLSVSITDHGATGTPGGNITYTAGLSNLGTQDSSNAVIQVTLPVGTSFNAGASTDGWSEVSPGLYQFSFETVAAQGSVSAQFVVTVNGPAAAGFDTATVTISGFDSGDDGADPDLTNNSASDTTPIDAAPDLSVTVSDGGSVGVLPGGTVVYTLTYRNNGTQGATNVVLMETLPAGTTFNAAESSPGWVETAPGSGVYQWVVGSLSGGGAGGGVLFAVTVPDPVPANYSQIVNTATIADDGANGADLTPADNTGSDSTDILGVDLRVTQTNNANSVSPGSTVAYVLTYSNVGVRDATGVVLTETLPAGAVFNAAASTAGWVETAPGSGVYKLAVGDLAAADSGSAIFAVNIVTPVAAGRETISNTVSIADDGLNGIDRDLSNNVAIETDALDAAPDLSVTVTDNITSTTPGSLVSYVLNYANTGTQGAEGVFLTQTLPLGTVFNAAASTAGWVEIAPGVYRLDIGSLAGSGTGTATFAVTVTGPAASGLHALHTSASIADDAANGADLNPANNTATDSTTLDAAPDLSVTITDNITSTTPGSLVSYVLNYANTGTQGAEGVFLTQTLPQGTVFNAAASTAGWVETAPGVYRLDIGSLAGNGTGNATFAVTVTGPAASGLHALHTSASIADDAANGADLNPANNTATDSNTLDAAPDLSVTITDNITSTTPGSLVSYVLNYANTGTQGAEGVFLTQTLPLGMVFNAAASNAGWVESAPGVYRLEIGSLAGNGTGTATFAVTVTGPAASGLHALQTSVTIADDAANGADLNPANNTATDSNTLDAAPDLSVTITDNLTSTTPGSLVSYVLNYANTGTQGAEGVFLTQTLPQGTVFNAAASTAGWEEVTPGVYRLEIGSLAGNGTGAAIFAVTVTSPTASGLDTLQTSATIADDAANGADLNPANNTATDSNTLVAAPDLTVSVTDNGALVAPGGTVVYVISYSNAGNQGATGVYLTETLPAHTSFDASQSTPGWTEVAPGRFRFDLGAVDADTAGTVHFAVRVEDPITPGVLEIGTAVAIADDTTNGADPTPANNVAEDTTPLLLVDLHIASSNGVASITPGGVVSYVLTYGNTGSQTASGVVITETLPAGTVFHPDASTAGWVEVSPGTYVLTVGDLSAGETGSVTFAVTVVDPATAGREVIVNAVAIADDGAHGPDLTPADNAATESDTLSATPDLRLSISDGDARARQGGILTYTLTFSNAGDQDATGVFLTQALPAGTIFVPGASSAGWMETTPGSRVYRLQVGDLAVAAGEQTVIFAVQVVSVLPVGQTIIEATAMISDDMTNGADPQPGDNIASDSAPVYKGIIAVARGRDGTQPSKSALEIPLVRVFDIATGLEQFSFLAFDPKYKKGVRVAVGDVNGDGYDDIIAVAAGNMSIRVFDGLTGERMSGPLGEFRPFSGKSAQNIFVAAGDLNGDGYADITVARGSQIQSIDGRTGELLRTFELPRMPGGARVAVGDVNGDGVVDIIASQAKKGTRTVVFDGATAEILHDFKAGGKSLRGTQVASGDITGDGYADIITSHRPNGKQAPIVQAFDGVTGALLKSFTPYTGTLFQSVRVTVADVNLDGIADIIAAASDRKGGNVRIFDGATLAPITDAVGFDGFPAVNLHLAGSNPLPAAQSPLRR